MRGKTISLRQQGIQTAKNKNKKIVESTTQFTVSPIAIIIWNNDAQVLINTCPECGNLVVGLKKPIAIPRNAAGFVSHGFSMKPI